MSAKIEKSAKKKKICKKEKIRKIRVKSSRKPLRGVLILFFKIFSTSLPQTATATSAASRPNSPITTTKSFCAAVDDASWLSFISFAWMFPWMWNCYKQRVCTDPTNVNLWRCSIFDSSNVNLKRFVRRIFWGGGGVGKVSAILG